MIVKYWPRRTNPVIKSPLPLYEVTQTVFQSTVCCIMLFYTLVSNK